MRIKLEEMCEETNEETARERLKELRSFIRLLHSQAAAQDVIHTLPDVFVWLLLAGQRVAYARIPAREILHASYEQFLGMSNSWQDIFRPLFKVY